MQIVATFGRGHRLVRQATRFVPIDRDTPLLLPPNLRDWVPADHLVHFIRERLWLNRGDIGFGQEAIMAWHEAAGEKRPKSRTNSGW